VHGVPSGLLLVQQRHKHRGFLKPVRGWLLLPRHDD
jgi:hypothetical protein